VLEAPPDVDGFCANPKQPRAQQFLRKIINHNSEKVKDIPLDEIEEIL
jgi:putative glutamine transport system ATP-binding protein